MGVQTAKQWRFHLTAKRQPSPLLRCAGSSAGPGAAVSAAGAAAAWGGPALACAPWPAGQRACCGPAHGSGVGQGGASGPPGGGISPEEALLCARAAGRRRPDWRLGAAGRAGHPWAALGWCRGRRGGPGARKGWGPEVWFEVEEEGDGRSPGLRGWTWRYWRRRDWGGGISAGSRCSYWSWGSISRNRPGYLERERQRLSERSRKMRLRMWSEWNTSLLHTVAYYIFKNSIEKFKNSMKQT